MKVLRNPVAVGLLALVAIGLVANSAIKPLLRSKVRKTFKPATVVQTVSAPARPVAPPPARDASPTSKSAVLLEKAAETPGGIDLDLVRSRAAHWLAHPRHDPFEIRHIPDTSTNRSYPPAMELLTLTAIWRQTDSSLAVLNNRSYMAGDSVLRFTIKSIENDRVWVQGPNGRESVEFKGDLRIVPPAQTNLQDDALINSSVAVGQPKPKP